MMTRDAIEGVDYEVVPIPGDDDQAYKVRFISGQYYGTECKYGTVRLKEDQEKDCAYLSFSYNILKEIEGTIVNVDDFEAHAAWILRSLLARLSIDASLGIKEADDNLRDSDLSGPFDGRAVLSEGDTPPKRRVLRRKP